MRYGWILTVLICSSLSSVVRAQALRDIDYAYLYNAEQGFEFRMGTALDTTGWTIFYRFHINDTSVKAGDFFIQWETRTSLADANPGYLPNDVKVVAEGATNNGISATIKLPSAIAPEIIVARVIHESQNRAWLFYRTLSAGWPVDSYLTQGGKPVCEGYVNADEAVTVHGAGKKFVSYYGGDFPAALPVFSERLGPVPQSIRPDSTFVLTPGSSLKFSRAGLYLLQGDTTAARALAFRVEQDYPKLSRISSLAPPLLYITTKQEYDRLIGARDEKRVFDRVILGITQDVERARTLIRNYFRRVELANQYFTSYKKGWKTDRGMVYTIYGPPDHVYRFEDRDVWSYDNVFYKVTFNFAKAPTVFDPDNYVLIRDDKYREVWYEMVDLWRAARF